MSYKSINYIIKTALVLSLFLLIVKPPVYSKTIQVDESLKQKSIGLFIEYIEDKEHELTFNDISGKKLEKRWTASENEFPGFGFSKSAYWIRFTVENTSDHEIAYFLQQKYPLIDSLKIRVENGKESKTFDLGDHKPFSDRPYEDRTFIVPLKLEKKSKSTLYLRYETTSSVKVFLELWSPAAFEKHVLHETRFLMLYYGIIAVMILYNLFVFFFVRRLEYLYYVFFILFSLLYIMSQNGTAFQFLLPSYPWWVNYLTPVVLFLLIIFAVLFALKFMAVKKASPALYKIVMGYAYFLIIIFFISLFLPYRPAMIISAAAAVVGCPLGIITGIRICFLRQRTAYFYTLSWFVFLTGAMGYTLMTFGVFPLNIITQWSWQIGSALQVILLSIALADRMNSMRRELKAFSENLEGKVRERTEELHAAMEEIEASNQQLVEARDALWGEMELAKKIQTVLLPKNPGINGFEISGYMRPADQVGGDYYDIINVRGMDWLIIGDVSGHGVPAGLVMMMVQTSIHTALEQNPDLAPSELLTIINRTIANNIKQLGEEKYMTITALAAHKDGKFEFSGLHQDIMVYRAQTETIESIETKGMWIGILSDITGMQVDNDFILEPGDTLLLYTDGITEAWKTGALKDERDPEFDMFGEKRLNQLLLDNGKSSTGNIIESILTGMNGYAAGDDITMLVVKRT